MRNQANDSVSYETARSPLGFWLGGLVAAVGLGLASMKAGPFAMPATLESTVATTILMGLAVAGAYLAGRAVGVDIERSPGAGATVMSALMSAVYAYVIAAAAIPILCFAIGARRRLPIAPHEALELVLAAPVIFTLGAFVGFFALFDVFLYASPVIVVGALLYGAAQQRLAAA